MALQNRVTPWGEIVADARRGTLMGNRGGRFHTSERVLGSRRWVGRRWSACTLSHPGRRRTVMGDGYTELFFLDEATALAAGHRPCFECRRADARSFSVAWAKAQMLPRTPTADAMDALLHPDRLGPRLSAPASSLPEGAIYRDHGRALLVSASTARAWSFSGYGPPEGLPDRLVEVLTPACIIAVLKSGYRAGVHVTASVLS